jgi:hypothetical protein
VVSPWSICSPTWWGSLQVRPCFWWHHTQFPLKASYIHVCTSVVNGMAPSRVRTQDNCQHSYQWPSVAYPLSLHKKSAYGFCCCMSWLFISSLDLMRSGKWRWSRKLTQYVSAHKPTSDYWDWHSWVWNKIISWGYYNTVWSNEALLFYMVCSSKYPSVWQVYIKKPSSIFYQPILGEWVEHIAIGEGSCCAR